MYNYEWDIETGGYVLTTKITGVTKEVMRDWLVMRFSDEQGNIKSIAVFMHSVVAAVFSVAFKVYKV